MTKPERWGDIGPLGVRWLGWTGAGPSVVAGVEPAWHEDIGGLPALDLVGPSLVDGRIAVRFRVQ